MEVHKPKMQVCVKHRRTGEIVGEMSFTKITRKDKLRIVNLATALYGEGYSIEVMDRFGRVGKMTVYED